MLNSELISWLVGLNHHEPLTVIQADASARKYFRLQNANLIAVDASSSKESCIPFIKIANLLDEGGLRVPQIIAADPNRGFLLLTDLGNKSYLEAIKELQISNDHQQIQTLMQQALDDLIRLQRIKTPADLAIYDADIIDSELENCRNWYISKHCHFSFNRQQQDIWQHLKKALMNNLTNQPQVLMHADFMVRNLLLDDDNRLGIIDFQDAVIGPFAYDLVSLCKDAFISFDADLLGKLVRYYLQHANFLDISFHELQRNFDFTAIFRHLRVLGVFARLKYLDNKPHYLIDAPRFITYITDSCMRYDLLKDFVILWQQISTQNKAK